jgi:hypothetical protein
MQYEQPDEMNNTHALDSRQAWPVIPVCSDNLSQESVIGPSSTPSQIRSQTSGITRGWLGSRSETTGIILGLAGKGRGTKIIPVT